MTTGGKPIGIALVSGGMDSLVMAEFCTRESDLALLHVNYGQRTEAKELSCFHAVAEHLKVPSSRRLVADIGYLSGFVGERPRYRRRESTSRERTSAGRGSPSLTSRSGNAHRSPSPSRGPR